jgi:hypothetical protein
MRWADDYNNSGRVTIGSLLNYAGNIDVFTAVAINRELWSFELKSHNKDGSLTVNQLEGNCSEVRKILEAPLSVSDRQMVTLLFYAFDPSGDDFDATRQTLSDESLEEGQSQYIMEGNKCRRPKNSESIISA